MSGRSVTFIHSYIWIEVIPRTFCCPLLKVCPLAYSSPEKSGPPSGFSTDWMISSADSSMVLWIWWPGSWAERDSEAAETPVCNPNGGMFWTRWNWNDMKAWTDGSITVNQLAFLWLYLNCVRDGMVGRVRSDPRTALWNWIISKYRYPLCQLVFGFTYARSRESQQWDGWELIACPVIIFRDQIDAREAGEDGRLSWSNNANLVSLRWRKDRDWSVAEIEPIYLSPCLTLKQELLSLNWFPSPGFSGGLTGWSCLHHPVNRPQIPIHFHLIATWSHLSTHSTSFEVSQLNFVFQKLELSPTSLLLSILVLSFTIHVTTMLLQGIAKYLLLIPELLLHIASCHYTKFTNNDTQNPHITKFPKPKLSIFRIFKF